MRHREVVALQIALRDTFHRPPEEFSIPPEQRAFITPEMRALIAQNPQHQALVEVFDHMSNALDVADAWHVDADTGGLLSEASLSLPPNTTFRETLVPATHGFMVFDTILSFPRIVVAGFVWRIIPPQEPVPEGGIMLLILPDHGPQSLAHPQMMPVPFGAPIGLDDREFARELAAIRLLTATFLFIEQRILRVAAPQPVQNRNAQRRLSKAAKRGRLPDVRVVRLRGRNEAQADAPGERHQVEWSHQWLVRGHWRSQWYPASSEHRPLYIAPYTKGPADKPIRTRRTVIDVS